tara:strand:- start:336 stop:692 length:357 start_codon:yes stop_codon:yes gene_type:complete
MIKKWCVNSNKRTEVTLQYKRYKKRHTKKIIYLFTHPKLGGKIHEPRVFDDGSCMVKIHLSYTLDTKEDKFKHESQQYFIICPCYNLHNLLKQLKKPKTVKGLRRLMKNYIINTSLEV